MWSKLRPILRSFYRFIGASNGFIYDLFRFLMYSGWRSRFTDKDVRSYNIAMVYHGLEKSLSYKERRAGSGWSNAFKLLDLLRYSKSSDGFGFHDRAAIKTLQEFISLPENADDPNRLVVDRELSDMGIVVDEEHGAMLYGKSCFEGGVLADPEKFFFSRYSLREFREEIVEEAEIRRAVKLAMKTPSVCNRQAWAVYHTSDQEIKDVVLSYQSGNQPFGNKIPNILVVTTDLKAFFAGNEHYQHWIDGGLFSMSLIYAFHSIGIATCALNWSQTPAKDKALRKKLNIKDSHTITMILAVGYPDVNNRVCVSARKPVDEILFGLEKRT